MFDKHRIEWIDLLRSAAIILVLLCHCLECFYEINIDFISYLSFPSKLFALAAYNIGRLGVPFFLMISGYLLLDRTYDTDKTIHFWKNSWLHLLICTYLWTAIYTICEVVINGDTFAVNVIFEEIFFLRDSSMSHMWFMPMLLGMYPLFPYVANGLKSIKTKITIFPIALYFVYAFVLPYINLFRAILGKHMLPINLSFGFSGGTLGLYFIFGYLIKKGVLKNLKSGMLFVASISGLVLAVSFQFLAYQMNYEYYVWYDSPFLALSAVTIFELCSRIKKVPFGKVFNCISRYSFGLFLIHNVIIRFVPLQINDGGFLIAPIKTIILLLFVLIISLFVSWMIERIPKIGKYLLYIK